MRRSALPLGMVSLSILAAGAASADRPTTTADYVHGSRILVATTRTTRTSLRTSSITVMPASLAFTYREGQPAPPAQSLSVTGNSGRSLDPSVSRVGGWFSTSGNELGNVTISVAKGLAPGSYDGEVRIAIHELGDESVSVPVMLTVTPAPPGKHTVSPALVAFHGEDGVATGPRQVSVTAPDGSHIPFTVSDPKVEGVTVSPMSGVTPAVLTISVDSDRVNPNTFTTALRILGESGVKTVAVMLPGMLTASPALLHFHSEGGEATQVQDLTVASPRGTSMVCSVSRPTVGWLTVNQKSGMTPAAFTIATDSRGLAPGRYATTLRVTGYGEARTVAVVLTVGAETR